MLYAWIDNNGTLCTTFELQSVPEQFRDSITIFEHLNIQDHDKLYVENGQIKEKTEGMIVQEMKEKLLSELKQKVYNLLQPSDWVVVKCVELGLNMGNEYSEIKQKRQAIRQANDTLESRINSATSIKELIEIQKDIEALK
ncbi:MAG: hypothetical protein QXV73_03905 [Candidatus Micrarchaeia archaeon]